MEDTLLGSAATMAAAPVTTVIMPATTRTVVVPVPPRLPPLDTVARDTKRVWTPPAGVPVAVGGKGASAGSIMAQLRATAGFLEMQAVPGFPGLYIGPAVAARSPANLARVSHILTVNGQPPLPPSLAVLLGARAPVMEVVDLEDDTEQEILSVLPRCLAFIDAARAPLYDASRVARGGGGGGAVAGVLVHCTLGMSRSAAVVAAYIMSRAGEALPAALARLAGARPWVRPNDGFLAQLAAWDSRGGVPSCDLCTLRRRTAWYAYGHPDFVVLTCDTCDTPMAVLRAHGTPWADVPPGTLAAVHATLLCAAAADSTGLAAPPYFDAVQRSVPCHAHLHLRPETPALAAWAAASDTGYGEPGKGAAAHYLVQRAPAMPHAAAWVARHCACARHVHARIIAAPLPAAITAARL